MSFLYVNEDGAVVGMDANRCVVTRRDGEKRYVPIETVEGITILGHAHLTTQCTVECLTRGIPVAYYSKGGVYFGRLQSTEHMKAARQRVQASLYDTDFALEFAKRILTAKVKNQLVVLRRYLRSSEETTFPEMGLMKYLCRKMEACTTINEIIGYEGQCAKYYFLGLSRCIEPEFAFQGRSKRPPRDAFNSMLGMGYSVLMNEIYGKIEQKGLNPYFGFVHRDSENHPTLASDLMEEWRAIIVDATVMSLINGHEIHMDKFLKDDGTGGVYLTRDGLALFMRKLEHKFQTQTQYLSYVDYKMDFRHAILMQVNQLVKAIEARNATLYEPIVIR